MGKPIIPFGWLPGHWGLRGDTRELARIDYEHDDQYQRETKKAAIMLNGDTLRRELMDIDLRHHKIDQRDYDMRMVEFLDDEKQKTLRTLEILRDNDEITELEYEKEVASVECRPWFHFDVDYVSGELELSVDWNSEYIEFLRSVGYGSESSATEDDVIDEYVRDFGRKLSEDHPEDDNDQQGYSFIKTMRESNDTVSYQ